MQAGAVVDARSISGTPLAVAIRRNNREVAQLLLDNGAKISNVSEGLQIPKWMNTIVAKRQNVKRGLLAFIGVLRKRVAVSGSGTEFTGGRLPRDVVWLMGRWVWSTRFHERWAVAIPDTASRCHLQ